MSTNTKTPRNEQMAAAMRDLRRSSAASPHKNKARYDRNRAKRQMRQEY